MQRYIPTMAKENIRCGDCSHYSSSKCSYYNLPADPDKCWGYCAGGEAIPPSPVPVKRINKRKKLVVRTGQSQRRPGADRKAVTSIQA